MNKRQRRLARHALGLPNRHRLSYRNRFIAGSGHYDYLDWMAMVRGGYALFCADDLFWLTEKGAVESLNANECASAEDFPFATTLRTR